MFKKSFTKVPSGIVLLFVLSGVPACFLSATPMCPSLTGAKGLYHLIAADNGYAGVFYGRLAFRATTSDLSVYYPGYIVEYDSVTGDAVITWSGIDSSGKAIDTYMQGDFDFAFALAVTNWLELNIVGRYKGDFIDCDDAPRKGSRRYESYESLQPDSSKLPDSNWVYNGWQNRASVGAGDMDIGSKIVLSKFYKMPFDFALYPYLRFATGAKRDSSLYPASYFGKRTDSNKGGVFRYFTNGKMAIGFSTLLSATTKTYSPGSGYVNLGYLFNGGKANEFQYGVGMDILFFNYLDPFIEFWGSRRSFGKDPLGDAPPSYITLGLKFLGTGISTDIAVDILVLGKAKYEFNDFIAPPEAADCYVATGWGMRPTWAINVGLGFAYDVYKMRPITNQGVIEGRVVDENTKKGISAVLAAGGNSRATSDPLTGTYDIQVAAGTARLVVSKEGYYDKTKTIAIARGEKQIVDFELKAKASTSSITGRVIDKWTTKPVENAKVALLNVPKGAFKESPIKPNDITQVINDEVFKLNLETGAWDKIEVSVETVEKPIDFDSLTTSDKEGIYHLEPAPAGTNIVTASAPDYITQSSPVVCKPDESATFNFELLAEKIILYGIHFEFNKSIIFVDSYPILDRLTQFLKDSPDIRVEIGGHTDWVGSDEHNIKLSTDRANAVRNYLIGHGVPPDRVTAKGYSKSIPIADNSTDEGRALNRRIELKIMRK